MALIPLRDYLGGIEELIDGEQIDDALAHCRQILRTFPKHIDTYRMMGKAYLEAHRYSEAEDIFRRVLSSCPDDFVAHIGMSIIREEARDQDGAIWNMERAFEAQPSNRAVQDELRRLYGKREGYAPPKVRLTRGALARMYAHGDLYTQAIGELRGALAEDPQRPDLQVLLAEMYSKTNRQTEAIDVCTKLIEKLPYCLYANQLLAEILMSAQRAVEARPYVERIKELDPYFAEAKIGASVGSVPADSVTIEQLILEGPAVAQLTPKAWAEVRAADEVAFGKEELPDWLSLEEEQAESSVPHEPEQAQSEAETETEPVLDSLKSLEPGFPVEDNPAEQAPRVPPFSQIPGAERDGQIPDWLKELGPATGRVTSEVIEEETGPLGQTDKLEQALSQEKATVELPLDATPAGEARAAPPGEEEDSLGWLERLAADQGAAEEELLTTPEEREQAIPAWAPADEPDKTKSDALTWLDEMEAENETKAQASSALGQAELPEIHGLGEAGVLATPPWLRELSAEAEEITRKTASLEPLPLEEAPDWLDELQRQSGLPSEAAGEEPAAEPKEEKASSGDLNRLDWMNDPGQSNQETRQGAWVPEAELAGRQTAEAKPAAPAAALRPRRAARMEAEALAGGQLEQARQALNFGKVEDAAQQYGRLLHRRLLVDDVIADLEAAVHRNPADATLWQTLGDAYLRNNQLREALDCYTKAEALL